MGKEYTYDKIRYGKSRKNMENHLHKKAISVFKFHNNFEDEAKYGNLYPQLMSYETSASFVYYLLEYKGSNDDFMRFFDDIDLMEEIYDMKMNDMIKEWLDYLDKYR